MVGGEREKDEENRYWDKAVEPEHHQQSSFCHFRLRSRVLIRPSAPLGVLVGSVCYIFQQSALSRRKLEEFASRSFYPTDIIGRGRRRRGNRLAIKLR